MKTYLLDFSQCPHIPCYAARKLAREAGRKQRANRGVSERLDDQRIIDRLVTLTVLGQEMRPLMLAASRAPRYNTTSTKDDTPCR